MAGGDGCCTDEKGGSQLNSNIWYRNISANGVIVDLDINRAGGWRSEARRLERMPRMAVGSASVGKLMAVTCYPAEGGNDFIYGENCSCGRGLNGSGFVDFRHVQKAGATSSLF